MNIGLEKVNKKKNKMTKKKNSSIETHLETVEVINSQRSFLERIQDTSQLQKTVLEEIRKYTTYLASQVGESSNSERVFAEKNLTRIIFGNTMSKLKNITMGELCKELYKENPLFHQNFMEVKQQYDLPFKLKEAFDRLGICKFGEIVNFSEQDLKNAGYRVTRIDLSHLSLFLKSFGLELHNEESRIQSWLTIEKYEKKSS